MKFTGPTIAELRASYPPEKHRFDRGNLWGFLVLRWTSFYPTWLLVRLGFSANAVTVLSLVLGFAGSVLLGTGKSGLDVAGAVLVNLAVWLDYVDGNIARYRRSESSYGHFLDEFVGSLVYVLFGIGAGMGAYNGNSVRLIPLLQGVGIPLLFVIVLTLIGLWAYTLRFLLRQSQEQFVNIFTSATASLHKPTGMERACLRISSVVDHGVSLLPPLLLLHAIFLGMGSFTVLYALLFSVSTLVALVQFGMFVERNLGGGAGRRREDNDSLVRPASLAPPKT